MDRSRGPLSGNNRLFFPPILGTVLVSNSDDDTGLNTREKIRGLYRVAVYRPAFTVGIICLSIVAAVLEGIGLSFLIPVIEIARGTVGTADLSGEGQVFVNFYDTIGVPFTLETVILGVALVMIARYSMMFLVRWLRASLQTNYTKYLQTKGFENALNAQISYYDERGSDEILNAIVTQTRYGSRTIRDITRIVEKGFLSLMYLAIALFLAPWLTILSAIILGGVLYGLRTLVESGYSVGDRVAEANERVQIAVQAGTQGIREVKLFNVANELLENFYTSIDQFAGSQIRLRRNQAVLDNFYQMMAALSVFGLIYVALRFSSLPLASLGVFLFAMFQLAPRVSKFNDHIYQLEGNLPHLVRTQNFIDELEDLGEFDSGTDTPPDPLNKVEFRDVEFGYGEKSILDALSFEVCRGEFVAFVGPSGAGKSTIVSLLARNYAPDAGSILANGVPIERFDLNEWRSKISIVRQDPHLFNQSLRFNITLGKRDATKEEIRDVCEIAQVTEFLDELPEGLDTELGDDGVRLSGGQRQRVAIARALLKDADVLVLDEATSDLDTSLEERVHQGIEQLPEYAMIVIAHRLSTVTGSDRIYRMEDGKIQEVGPHDELLVMDEMYAEMYKKQ